jgi:hypothetical protein
VPKRFDLSTIFVVTAAYSILLGSLTALHVPSNFVIFLAAFITFVGIGQALLFCGRKPRLASVLVGAILTVLSTSVTVLYYGRVPFTFAIYFVAYYSAFGSLFGYLAGVLVGSVFLLADVIRRRYKRPVD